MNRDVFRFVPAADGGPVLFASPHSGRNYTAGFLAQSVLTPLQLRTSEDAFVDELVAHAPVAGADLLLAHLPRAYIDLNRACDELDPAIIDGAFATSVSSPRIYAGLGVIARIVARGQAIYRGKISLAEAQKRIDEYWHPYHDFLKAVLAQKQRDYGQAVLIDCHSMPLEAVIPYFPHADKRPDIVLGDRFGLSADGFIVDIVEQAFMNAGLRVGRNVPFSGAYMAKAYGKPRLGQHVVQIEINRSLYMNEKTLITHEGFVPLKAQIDRAMTDICRRLGPKRAMAAQ